MKKILTMILLLVSFTVSATQDCSEKTIYGTPTSGPDTIYLCRIEYFVAYSPNRKSAYWSAEHLTKEKAANHGVRKNEFKSDPELSKSIIASPSDYDKTNFDRGHLTPFDDVGPDPIADAESFYMSNIVPQVPENNRNGWKALEIAVRTWAIARNELYVITGPIYSQNIHDPIGRVNTPVPDKLFKIIVDPTAKEILVFVVPNIPITKTDLPKFISDLNIVENLTGIRFFPLLTDTITPSSKMW